MELRKISFHYLELKAEKDILMEILWIFFNSIIRNFNGTLIKFQIMELKKIRMVTIKMLFLTLIPDNGNKCSFIIS